MTLLVEGQVIVSLTNVGSIDLKGLLEMYFVGLGCTSQIAVNWLILQNLQIRRGFILRHRPCES